MALILQFMLKIISADTGNFQNSQHRINCVHESNLKGAGNGY